MHPLRHKSFWVIGLLALLSAAIFWLRPTGDPVENNGGVSASTGARPDQALRVTLDRASLNPAGFRENVDGIRSAILESPKSEALAIIREFLASGKDIVTGTEFEIGTGGALKSHPTLRTMLLDLVAGIDPEAAAEIAREILAKPTTADEWAIALRNIGRFDEPDGTRDFLRAKTEELIRNPAWQANPSVGYLNAFDVLVHTEAVESTPLLSSLVQNKERKDLSHAAFLTLDRLVQRQPEEMLEQIAADTALQQSRPEMTAQQFARADLRDEGQRDIVARWLLDPARTPTELRSFAGVFPNHNQFVSNNLLTRDNPVSGFNLSAHDREVLEIVRSWQQDAALQSIRPHLDAIATRLVQFTGSSNRPEP